MPSPNDRGTPSGRLAKVVLDEHRCPQLVYLREAELRNQLLFDLHVRTMHKAAEMLHTQKEHTQARAMLEASLEEIDGVMNQAWMPEELPGRLYMETVVTLECLHLKRVDAERVWPHQVMALPCMLLPNYHCMQVLLEARAAAPASKRWLYTWHLGRLKFKTSDYAAAEAAYTEARELGAAQGVDMREYMEHLPDCQKSLGKVQEALASYR